jgi:hypothetical protein
MRARYLSEALLNMDIEQNETGNAGALQHQLTEGDIIQTWQTKVQRRTQGRKS